MEFHLTRRKRANTKSCTERVCLGALYACRSSISTFSIRTSSSINIYHSISHQFLPPFLSQTSHQLLPSTVNSKLYELDRLWDHLLSHHGKLLFEYSLTRNSVGSTSRTGRSSQEGTTHLTAHTLCHNSWLNRLSMLSRISFKIATSTAMTLELRYRPWTTPTLPSYPWC